MLDVPERPKNLKPDEVRAEHIKMSWQKPDDDGGSPITGYVLRMMDLEAGNWITIEEVSFEVADRMQFLISLMINITSYTCMHMLLVLLLGHA